MNNEEESVLIEKYKRLSSDSQRIALAQIIMVAEVEEKARKRYGALPEREGTETIRE